MMDHVLWMNFALKNMGSNVQRLFSNKHLVVRIEWASNKQLTKT